MTVADAFQKYFDARKGGSVSESDQKQLVTAVDELFNATSKLRQKDELEWYVNQRFVDGDHWIKFDKQAGKITNETETKKIRRSINLIRAEVRGLKNMVQKIPLTVEVVASPKSNSPEDKAAAEDEAKQKNTAWRAIEYDLKLRHKIPGMVEDGFIKYSGWMVLWPTSAQVVAAKWRRRHVGLAPVTALLLISPDSSIAIRARVQSPDLMRTFEPPAPSIESSPEPRMRGSSPRAP